MGKEEVCVIGVLRSFQQSFSHITTVAACCMRRDSARVLSAANTDVTNGRLLVHSQEQFVLQLWKLTAIYNQTWLKNGVIHLTSPHLKSTLY